MADKENQYDEMRHAVIPELAGLGGFVDFRRHQIALAIERARPSSHKLVHSDGYVECLGTLEELSRDLEPGGLYDFLVGATIVALEGKELTDSLRTHEEFVAKKRSELAKLAV